MGILTCTYCGTEITAQAVEAEDGHCPECGAIITLGRSNFEGDEELDEDAEGFDEIEEEDGDLMDDDDDRK